MNTSIQHPELNGIVQPSGDSSQSEATLSAWRKLPRRFTFAALLAGLLLLLFSAPAAHAQPQGVPPGCAGSGLGIFLYTPTGDSHIGCTICYSVLIFNGGIGPVVCDASNITAFVVTPDGTNHPITLSRTYLSNGQSDFYTNAACYTIRTNDILSDGTVRATARDIGIILQNDTPSASTNEQGVNTEVGIPGLKIAVSCVPSVGQNGAITYTGTVTNTGNNPLFNVTVTNSINGLVTNFPSIATSNFVSFSGFWVPLNPCSPSTNTFTAQGNDSFTNCAPPTPIFSSAIAICQNTLTPGIIVTKTCPLQPVPPGQPLTFSGSVSNSGNVTLTNIVVVNNQPVSNTLVITVASLAPGAVTNFTGSYVAPTNCSVTDTLTAIGRSACGVAVTNSASATCTILTTPQITVTANCPTGQVLPGGSLTYSVMVQNTGSFTLTNVVVVSSLPVPNTVVFTRATLASGVSTNFTAGPYTVPANACTVTATFSGTGKEICTFSAVTNSVSTTCTVTTTPGIGVTLACPATNAAAGTVITYTGTVTNSGNVILTNVTVVDNQASPSTVFTVSSLAPHTSAPFTASFTAPTNACSVSSTVTATGFDNCTQNMVTSTASATCTLITTPLLVVTQFCPVTYAVIPGGPVNYNGSVSNAGNVTLTNIVVVNNQPVSNTVIITVASLAPGAATNFNGSYTAPTNCSTTSISTATGLSICGVAVTNTVSATCPISTAPAIVVTANCPTGPVVPGGSLTYSGTVQNTGNITLTNVVVVSSLPAPNTPVIGPLTLAPGGSTNFTAGPYTVPANACTVTNTFSGTGQNICTLSAVTNSFLTTCTVTTAPGIGVTLACPVPPAVTGGLVIYTGTVTNSGNVTLNNVTVINNPASPSTVFFVSSLAPNASAIFTATNTAPTDTCSVSSTVTATGSDNCTQKMVTNTASAGPCPLITTPGIVVTKSCPAQPVAPGQTFTFSGSVSNTGNVTLNSIVVVNNQPATNTVVFTWPSLAPGAVANFTNSYPAPTNCSVTDTLTATATSRCGVAVTNTVTATCPILTTPAIVVTQLTCPTNPAGQGGILTYSGTVSNAGNITLTNIIVVNNWPYSNVIFTASSLAPGVTTNFTGSYVVPANCCVAWMWVVASGQGCAGVTVTDTDSGTCTVFTSPSIVVTKVCATRRRLPRPGELLTYSGSVSNAGNITLINVTVVDNQPTTNTLVLGPITLAPGQSQTYAGSYVVPVDFCGDDTVTAIGFGYCFYTPVTNSVTAICPIAHNPAIGVTKQCPEGRTRHGYPLTFHGRVSNLGDVTLVNVYVVDDQPTNNTPVIGPITLAPGASTNFTGSYTTPLVCCVTIDTLTATGQDHCSGSNVTAEATAICPMLYTPGIALVQNCPPNLLPGNHEFSGYVTNTGDAILTNVVVFGSQPCELNRDGEVPSQPLGDLAPGESEPYTVCLYVPYDTCEVTVIVTSQETCAGTWITNSVSCPVTTTPCISITENCQQEPVIEGKSVDDVNLVGFGGTVCNCGNITLTNIYVFSSQLRGTLVTSALLDSHALADATFAPSVVLGPITLGPGACSNFMGSFYATGGNLTTNSVITTNITVILNTNAPMWFGTIDPVALTFSNRFNVPSNLDGLMYIDQNPNWGPTLFYSIQEPGSGADTFDTISTIANIAYPGQQYVGFVTNEYTLTLTGYDALTFAAPNVGYGSVNFYYLRHDNTGVAHFGEIIAQGASSDADLPNSLTLTGFTGLAFAADNVNGYGANMFYYVRNDTNGLSWFGSINPTPGLAVADLYTVGTNFDSLVYVTGAPGSSGWGTNYFAYLRHTSTGSIIGTINPLTQVATDRMSFGTNFLIALTFTTTDVGYGLNLFYYLGGSSVTVTNYTTNSVVSLTPTNTVWAIGWDICQDGQPVTAAWNCLGPVTPPSTVLVIGTPTVNSDGFFGLSFPTVVGESYIVQYKNTLLDPSWITLYGPFLGDGTTWTIPDPSPAALNPTRFYRVVSTP